jgi:hypothetical protein
VKEDEPEQDLLELDNQQELPREVDYQSSYQK